MPVTPIMKLRDAYKELKLDNVATDLYEDPSKLNILFCRLMNIDPTVYFDEVFMLSVNPTRQKQTIRRLIYDKLEEILDELARIEKTLG
ncbi:MAG: hypothetical protein IMZ70_01355 [Candidatus Atribacteria bacterium]|nr:hypothetical protein [Candidatus Atribacteria bacterium]MBE3145009.1 hypothetical protein [Planctomycetota bacterium]